MNPTPPPEPVSRLDDRQLIDLAVETQVTENASRARRLSAIVEFHRRQERAGGQRSPADPSYFVLTPLQATTAEFAPLLSVTDMNIEIQLDTARRLQEWFPNAWALCESGRLDLGRATLMLDAVTTFANESDIPRFAELMDAFLDKYDDKSSPIVTVTRAQLQRAARHRRSKFPQQTDEETFAAAFKKRAVHFRPDENGIGYLGATSMVTDLMTADYRLTLIAKKLQERPDEVRTLDQIRADSFVDLLLGRLEVSASMGALEAGPDDEQYDGRTPADYMTRHATGAYARPVINVTVPIQSLIGLSDEPGTLSGGNTIPAELIRIISADPDSTWHRMLTDGARCVELSTNSYQPTKPIWRHVVARDQVCIWHGCNRPAVRVELDHRVPYPLGRTTDGNLAPLCKRHHKVKHANGFQLIANRDGSYTWTTAHGSTFTSRPPEQPVAEWPDPDTVVTEIADASPPHQELVLTA